MFVFDESQLLFVLHCRRGDTHAQLVVVVVPAIFTRVRTGLLFRSIDNNIREITTQFAAANDEFRDFNFEFDLPYTYV